METPRNLPPVREFSLIPKDVCPHPHNPSPFPQVSTSPSPLTPHFHPPILSDPSSSPYSEPWSKEELIKNASNSTESDSLSEKTGWKMRVKDGNEGCSLKKDRGRDIGQQIWSVTHRFLGRMREIEGKDVVLRLADLLRPENNSNNPLGLHVASLLLHAIEVARKFPPRTHKNTHFYHKFHRKNTVDFSNSVRLKGKTGRKPKNYECFLCPEVLPYKVTLIHHYQTCHQINRSQSVLYKRVNQSPETMKRLYHV